MNSEPRTPRLKAVAAMARNRVIGRDGKLPWHLPEDLKWFKKCTLDRPILMGRKTFESFPRLLPRRRHIVLSRTLRRAPEGVEVVASLEELDDLNLKGDVYVIGGAGIYRLLLPRCSDLYLSCLREDYQGDVVFPPFEDGFALVEVLAEYPEFEIRHYRNRSAM